MEVVLIGKKDFDIIQKSFEAFVNRVDDLCDVKNNKTLKKWIDNQDVCQILNITKRTLQNYRNNGTVPYTMVGHKAYYRPEDIERVIINLKMK